MPEITLNSVVFPEPFGPMTPWISPALASNDTPASACRPLNRLLTASTRNATPSGDGGTTFSLVGAGDTGRAVHGIGKEGHSGSNRRRRSEAAPASPRGANTTVATISPP